MKKKVVVKKKKVVKSKLVMVRTYSAGVHFGTLVSRKGKEVVLKDAHRVFYWSNACSLSQLSVDGSIDPANKISMAVSEIILTEAIEIMPLTQKSFEALTSRIWKK
jgi:hypothetical protein